MAEKPISRKDLKEILGEFKTELKTELKTEIRTELLGELSDELTAKMREIETNLLTAFHHYAQANVIRLNTMDVTDRELRLRMDVLESRMLALETRRPPAA